MEKILELMLLSLYQKPNYDKPNKVVFVSTSSLLQFIEASYQRPFEEMESALGKILRKHGFESVAHRNDKGEVFKAWMLEEKIEANKEIIKTICELNPNQYRVTEKGNVVIFTGTEYE
jgi:hypothetical protein